MQKKNILFLVPIWPPSTGGASTYYPLLIKNLLKKKEIINDVCVITENTRRSNNDEPQGVFVYKILPNRISRNKRPSFLFHAILYFIQNLKYLSIKKYISKHDINVVVIHSSFFMAPSILKFILNKKNFNKKILVIADIRDCRSDKNKFSFCDVKLFCSKNLLAHYSEKDGLNNNYFIPAPFEKFSNFIEEKEINKTYLPKMEEVSLHKPIIVYAGMIRKIKNIHNLIYSFLKLAQEFPNSTLILAGQIRDKDNTLIHKLISKNENIIYVGELSKLQLYKLICSADLVVNPSMIESISRLCLESLSFNVKTLCPKNIPEYADVIPDWTVNGDDINDLYKKISWALKNSNVIDFDFEQFSPELVTNKLIDIISLNQA